MRAAAAGDPEAAGRLWEANRPWVRACALAHLARGVDVEDVLQDVALRMWRALPELRDASRFRPWLGEIARNTARSHARSTPTRRDCQEPEAEPAARAESTGRDDLDDVLARLHTLPADYREPLLLKAVDGLTQREVAELLELSEAAVETRLARARRALRDAVHAAHGPAESSTRRPTSSPSIARNPGGWATGSDPRLLT